MHVFEKPCGLAGLNMLMDKQRWAEVPTVRPSTTDVDPPLVSAGHFTSKKIASLLLQNDLLRSNTIATLLQNGLFGRDKFASSLQNGLFESDTIASSL